MLCGVYVCVRASELEKSDKAQRCHLYNKSGSVLASFFLSRARQKRKSDTQSTYSLANANANVCICIECGHRYSHSASIEMAKTEYGMPNAPIRFPNGMLLSFLFVNSISRMIFFFFSLFLRLSLPLPALRFCSLLVGVKLSNNIFPYVYLMAHSSKYRSSRIFSFISSVVFRVVRREIDGAVASYIDEHMCVYVLPDYHFGCCCCCYRWCQGAGRYTKWANNILN